MANVDLAWQVPNERCESFQFDVDDECGSLCKQQAPACFNVLLAKLAEMHGDLHSRLNKLAEENDRLQKRLADCEAEVPSERFFQQPFLKNDSFSHESTLRTDPEVDLLCTGSQALQCIEASCIQHRTKELKRVDSTTTEDAEQLTGQVDLFSSLCGEREMMDPKVLDDLIQQSPTKRADCMQNFSEICRRFNLAHGWERDGTMLSHHGFNAMLHEEDIDLYLPEAMVDSIQAVRGIFAEKSISAKVARCSMVSESDLHEAPEVSRKKTRAMKILDSLAFTMILVNAVVLGARTDWWNRWVGWDWVEQGFTAFFFMELSVKIYSAGLVQHFTTSTDWKWNIIDAMIVLLALADSILFLVVSASGSLSLLKLMRLARLFRITRLARLLRLPMFKELLLMINGVLAGMKTLMWAIVLLFFVIYVLGVLTRHTLGQCADQLQGVEVGNVCAGHHLQSHSEALFSSMGRSCFTVFRCFTDGCNSPDGTPLMVHIYEEYEHGGLVVFFYVMCFLLVTFGLFNLIMAIFVENTMEAAKVEERKRHSMYQVHDVHVARKLKELVIKFLDATGTTRRAFSEDESSPISCWKSFAGKLHWHGVGEKKEAVTATLPYLNVQVTRSLFQEVMSTQEVGALLEELEISVSHNMDLFDTLDADGNGRLDLNELVKGLLSLRGRAEKSDVVAATLAVRATRRNLKRLDRRIVQNHKQFQDWQASVTKALLLGEGLQER